MKQEYLFKKSAFGKHCTYHELLFSKRSFRIYLVYH